MENLLIVKEGDSLDKRGSKMTKKKMDNIGQFFPNQFDVVSDDFSYAKYIDDVDAFRKGILQGYLEDYQAVPIILYDEDKDKFLDNSIPYISESFAAALEKIGNIDILDYEREISLLHDEFVSRILAGEDLATVDKEISLKMVELATRNNDGTHNEMITKRHR